MITHRVISFTVLLAVLAIISLQQRRIAQLEGNDRAQTRQIGGLANIATAQESSLEGTTNLVGKVIKNQQSLVDLIVGKKKTRRVLSGK